MEQCGYPYERLDDWAHRLAAVGMPEVENATQNWRKCIEHLLTARVDAWFKGERHTVAQVLEALDENEISLQVARRQLAQVDIGLLDNGYTGPSWTLAVPNRGTSLARLFQKSEWAGCGADGSWHWALRQEPASIIITDKALNRVSIGGHQMRCTLINIYEWSGWLHVFG